MSAEWKQFTIKEVATVITGKTPPGTHERYFGGNALFVTPTDMGDYKQINVTNRTLSAEGEKIQRKYLFERGIVVSCIGWQMGKAAVVEKLAATNQQINTVIPNEKIISFDFLYYILKSKRDEIFNLGATATRTPILKKSLFEKITFKAPKIEQQRIISGHLSSLDQKIELNYQINKTLEQMAQALFKSWFVDFEPIKAKIAARQRWQALQPENESASPVCYAAELDEPPALGDLETTMNRAAMQAISGKTAAQLNALREEDPERYHELHETAALFPSAMQASELGEIPEGWDCLSLDQIAKYQNGLALQKFRPEKEDNYLPVVKISQLKKGYADGEEKASPNINPECIIDNGDVVFSWSGSLIVDTWCGGRAALNQHLFKVTSSIYPKWLYFHFTRHHLEEFQRIAADKTVTMGHIKREHLKQALCAVPDVKCISIGNVIESMFEKQINIRLESLTLSQMRDTLLPKLLSGQISEANRGVA